MDFFELKKLIGSLVMPLPLMLMLVLLGLIQLIRQKRRSGLLLMFLPLVLLILLSTPFISNLIIEKKEASYSAFNSNKHPVIHYVVVLGCKIMPNKSRPANSQLGHCSLARLYEGLRLAKLYPSAKLVVSGGGFKGVSNSEIMRQAAIAIGFDPQRILLNPKARDTAEEALLLAPKLVDNQVALVTSIAHMQRAVELFNQQGVDVIAAPTDWQEMPMNPLWRQFVPTPEALMALTEHQHEWIGNLWLEISQ
ncbi:YdcF family protein [Pseudoalteromonas tunicata]|uniref:DUF218 domain-containing protein n=1 Tax=Pseudoalteromonas tunicata D2 TaxID=87626 RepID=A4CFF9_9GAMM|nr:YdcF family protein [Pseudoalteromonas tunicata]ATC95168.1 hypothetical protein PTUN_a2730 [Pseudoalteromonas tunicata]EAR26497.1 hypothetical protein PTD2_22487 [Pseudoalteromonas tunicata D2]MDP4982620.1 YdcF family protein [Pseudoalteromonas tunicata]MDP5215463.1 YdcF family protein [Pseudoalteromonas tunicata]